MNRNTGLIAILGIIALLVLGLACTNEGAAENPETGAPETMEISASGTEMAAGATPESVAGSGIWVNGQATVTVEPDLVLLNIGVEAIAETVAEARAEAAGAMDAIVAAVKAHGLEDQDVQTQSFNIWPQYEYPEVNSGGTRTRKQVLVGYKVSNSARIKIRDVDAVGTIIDSVAEAGGDATRIDGINFSIEDPKPFMTQLREEAVQDAVTKAEHLATLTGVEVGNLLFIGEVGAGSPREQPFMVESMGMARAVSDSATSISGGELQLSLNVQAAFSIQ